MTLESYNGGIGLLQTTEQMQAAEMHPLAVITQGTEFLRHLKGVDPSKGVESFWVEARDDLIGEYPRQRVMAVIVWGSTGVGKKLGISELVHLADHDPVLLQWLKEKRLKLRKSYISFAESANLARAEGNIHPSHGHGRYTPEEYREASKVHWRFVSAEFNNFEQPALVFIEPSGPTASVSPTTGEIEGVDRAFSSVYLLTKYHKQETRVLVIKRGQGLLESMVDFREALLKAKGNELASTFNSASLQFYRGENIVDLHELSISSLLRLRRKMLEGMAPAAGIIRSMEEMDQMMIHRWGMRLEEDELWPRLLGDDLNLAPYQYTIVDNPATKKVLSMHLHRVERYDPVARYRKLIKAV